MTPAHKLVTVPVEPTEAMRIAAINTQLPSHGEPPLYEKIYRAMIAAAPPEPTVEEFESYWAKRHPPEPTVEEFESYWAKRHPPEPTPSDERERVVLQNIITAWGILPEGRYRPQEIEFWLRDVMRPAIRAARSLLADLTKEGK